MVLNVFLAFNYHSHAPRFSYHGALWADRAGYFIYLPATFQYGFQASDFPIGLDTLTGNGFALDDPLNVVRTKYTSGVAILQAPIYILAHTVSSLGGHSEEAFGDVDHLVVTIAGPLFASLGLLFLFGSMRDRFSQGTSLLLLFVTYAGSNLFFYTVGDPGMSHVYSFFLFAAYLALQRHINKTKGGSICTSILLGSVIGLILLIRPTNLVFLLAAPFYAAGSWMDVRQRIDILLKPSRILIVVTCAVLVWLPQLMYWKHAYGSMLIWPYSGEGFSGWASPKLLLFWLSTNNGLFPYSPIYFFALVGAVLLWRMGQRPFAASVLLAFLATSYLGASWWVWHFGCSFGSRTLAEYMALFPFAIGALYEKIRIRWGHALSAGILLLLVVLELKLIYSYGNCWFEGDWNWTAFSHLLFGPTK